MQAELDRLLAQKRACGSEEESRKLEARGRDLQQRIQTLVVTPAPTSRDVVCFGATVKVQDSYGEQTTYRIVGIDEADAERDRISWRSPLARALLSHRVGDKVEFNAPAGARQIEILEIGNDQDAPTDS
jgi:transcription elongation factor GreB